MKNIRIALFGFLILLFVNVPSVQGAPLPSWSVSLKGGAYQPTASEYDLQYGHPSAFRGDLELGHKITPQIEVGLSIGYFIDNGGVRSTSGRLSSLKQELTLIPTQFFIIYQFAFEETQLLVPYLGGGYSHVTYHRSVEGEDAVMGGINGYHARTGVKLLLNRLEPDAANKLYENWGIVHSYFLLEGQHSRLNDFGNQDVNLGGWSYFGGIQCDF